MMNLIEIEAAEALLDIGVSLPFKEIRIPFSKKKFSFRITMRRPCYGNIIRIARNYIKLGVTYEQIKNFTKDEEMAFIATHGKRISRMIALTICRGFFSGYLLSGFMAWMIRWSVSREFIAGANEKLISFIGTKDFTPIIRSIGIVNPLRPRLSHKKTGS